ncbi:MAG: cysteine lyase [Thermosynechococcus sp.]|uniref:aminotransferase class V-fold PLP-dependent enzyme n=1 Tax=Thermosynechococcus sp. TaxID=2814275 RepID=UPI0022063002|nr:aminotransferase class V-fold PLP-dependent enzyme [Thermosynechococcus sp.]BCX11759.1 MAG: cysteine lyase [Thermosynechococcus sp.]
MDLETLRAYHDTYPALLNKIYLNYGGQGPLHQDTWQAIIQSDRHIQEQGPFANRVFPWLSQQLHTLRAALAQLLGTTPETIALTDSVTTGCNIVLWGINWQAGDHLLISNCEHPGVVAITEQLARRLGVVVDRVAFWPWCDDEVAAIEAQLHPRTRLVVLSHLLWNTGKLLPLERIVDVCHRRGIQVLADGAQTVGMVPLDLPALGVDYYAFTGHKWCCGPAGLGGLYIRRDRLAPLEPTFIGWRSIHQTRDAQPAGWKEDASRFEVATTAFSLVPGLITALRVHDQWGTPQGRYERICQLSHHLWHQLRGMVGLTCLSPVPPPSGLVAFQLANGQHRQLVQDLEAANILVRELLYPPSVRACVHYFTLPQECDRLVSALKQWMQANP